MRTSLKIKLLKRILLAKVLITFFVWGFPALFGTEGFLQIFGLSMPDNPIYLRLFGAVVSAFGVAYWFAYRDPVRNRAILQAGIVDNGLVTLVIIIFGITRGVESWFIWMSALFTGIFFISFIALLPKRDMAAT